MDHFQETARQLALEFDGGTALLNRFARRLWGRSQCERDRAEVEWSFPWNDDAGGTAVTRGTPALLNHCRRLLGEEPLRVIHHGNRRVCIEVFSVLEYVIDPGAGCLVMSPSGQGAGFVVDGRAREEPAIRALAYERVDLLEPLRSPLWLQLLAFGPGGICEGRGQGDLRQGQLWADCPNVVHALRTICDQAITVLRKDAGFRRLEAALSFCLIKYIGAEAVRLTLRSRARSYVRGFDARNVTKVWRFQAVFSRVDRENPMLLPVLQAWLQEDGSSDTPPPEAAISSMRRDLIESGLPAEAWRYVCKHGPRLLARCRGTRLSWSELLLFLRILRDARWPDPPPRGFLGLLYDTAGIPAGYLDPGDGVPGWFWNWACREANACHHDPQAFRRLKDEIVRWAWLVRAYRPRPDSNQQRRGMKWLRTWATLHESMTGLSDEDAWALWLRNIPWDRVTSLRVVPLLSPRSLREEGIAMHNCADRYLSECRKGGYALLSLRDPRSQRRVALLGMCLDVRSDEWRLRDLAGPCNSSVPEWIREVAHDVVHMANAARQKRRDPHVIREKDAERMANALV